MKKFARSVFFMTYHTGNQLIDPYLIFGKVHLQQAMHVADFGAGRTGHIVFPAAKLIGEKGVVYAVDILKDVLESIKKRAQIEGFVNIHEVWADIERSNAVRIPGGTLDTVFMINVLYHFKDYVPTLEEAARLLKEKGRVAVVDWVKPLGNIGPKNNTMVDFSKLIEEARGIGFALQDDFELGPYHRCIIFYQH